MKIDIKCRFSDSVLFSHECESNTIKLTLELAVKARANLYSANLAGANLAGADLYGANLSDANLYGANLAYANLYSANLAGANLAHANLIDASLIDANLYGANLAGANLAGADLADANLAYAYLYGANLARANLEAANLADANLAYAYLYGANLAGANLAYANLKGAAKLQGDRPIFQIGPIGSRCAYFVAYITDKGLRFDAGCQRQITREAFESRLANEHGDNIHANEYRAALALIDAHADLWTPKQDEKTEEK